MTQTTRLLRNAALAAVAAASLTGNAQALTNPCHPVDFGRIWDPCPTAPSPWDRRPWEKPGSPCGCLDQLI